MVSEWYFGEMKLVVPRRYVVTLMVFFLMVYHHSGWKSRLERLTRELAPVMVEMISSF